jgi:hypothetical protein
VLFDPDAFLEELRSLRKGRGAQRSDVVRRLGPLTRTVFGVSDEDRPFEVRHRLRQRIEEYLERAPNDLRTAALAALALHPAADHATLRGREAWLAAELTCSETTARRRVEEAFGVLVDEVRVRTAHGRHGPAGPSDGWYVRSFRAIMRLDTPTPELIEERVISFTRSGVAEIACQISLPRPTQSSRSPYDLQAEVIYGGRIRAVERPAETAFNFLLELATAGRTGDTHEYGICFRLPEGQPMRPLYVFQPLRPCDSFDLIVRFNPDACPDGVRLLDGATLGEIDGDGIRGHTVAVDRFGELRLRFQNLRQGLAYGVRWVDPLA